MKYLKTYKLFEKKNSEINIREWAYEHAKENHEGFNSYEDAVEHLDYLFETDFPYGFNDIPDEITLYRYLDVTSKKDITLKKLGIHYVAKSYYNMTAYDMQEFFELIGLNPDDESNIYMVTIKTNKNNINLEYSIINRLNFPNENEWTLKENAKYKVEKVEKLKKELYSL